MEEMDWRGRLKDALKSRGMSMRAASLKAGHGPGYINSILNDGRDPSVDALVSVCEVIGVSISEILYGYSISAETEEILTLLEKKPAARAHLLKLLREAL